jgi:hypothetical protein
MARPIKDDAEFVRRVDELGRQGLTQEKIAEAVGEASKWAVRSRLNELGLALESMNRIRDKRTKRYLSELPEFAAEAPAGVGA